MLYAYRFKTTDEFRRMILYLIHDRIPDKKSKLKLFNIDNVELVKLYEEEKYKELLRYLNAGSNCPFSISISKINDEDIGFISPSYLETIVKLFDDNTNTNIQTLKTSENTKSIRDFIYFMESHQFDYIAKQLDWHLIYDVYNNPEY